MDKYDKKQKKAKKISGKYLGKIESVKSNETLTDEEKIQTYKKILSDIDVALQKNNKKADFNEKLYLAYALTATNGKPLLKGCVNALSFLGILFGGLFILTGHTQGMQIAGGVIAGLGGLLGLRQLIDLEVGGDDPLYEKIATKSMYKNINCRKALEEIKSNLQKEIDSLSKNQEMEESEI